jgi:hypothetical protein
MLELMTKSLSEVHAITASANSVWGLLLDFCNKYDILIVPRVHEIRFIPKWFAPKFEKTKMKELKGVLSSNGSWAHARHIGGVVVLPSAVNTQTVTAIEKPVTDARPASQAIALDNVLAQGIAGHYIPKDGTVGTLLVSQRDDWAGKITTSSTCRLTHIPEQKESNESTGISTDGKDPTKTELDNKPFYDRLAEMAYWDEVLKGNSVHVLTPIRFDVCPGSTVKLRNGGDVRLAYNRADSLMTEFAGFVVSTTISFDTINATAGAQYTLSHVRDIDDVAHLADAHPVYACGPFSDASWTKDRFKTIDGSE